MKEHYIDIKTDLEAAIEGYIIAKYYMKGQARKHAHTF